MLAAPHSQPLRLFSAPQNIRVWDMQDYICLQSFCGKLFALGNFPITSAYFHKNDNTLICSTYSVSATQEGGGVVAACGGWPHWQGTHMSACALGWPPQDGRFLEEGGFVLISDECQCLLN